MADNAISSAIEGGKITETDPDYVAVSPVEVRGPRDVEGHRQFVTISLIALLAVIVVGQYVCLVVLEWNGKKVDSVIAAYNSALPVVAGLTGSAVTYYFTHGSFRRGKGDRED
jgi:hypothetical protein